MPIYEYHCEKCGDFELTQRISDPPAQRCPRCRRKVRRLISSTSFQLKGAGWYVTDYARSGAKSGGDAATNGAASDGGTPAPKSETTETSSPAKTEKKTDSGTAKSTKAAGAASSAGS
jgi:putative FmdB family regulatory protein